MSEGGADIPDLYQIYKKIQGDHNGSIYEQAREVGGEIANPLRFPQWPNPVDSVVNFSELACQSGWQATVKFAAASYARFAWATFVPSPAELTRKFLLGGYKCGFYFLPKIKSPLDLVIGEEGTSILARAAEPFTKVLFYWWVAESVAGAISTWTTVMHRQEQCNDLDIEVKESNALATLIWGTHNTPPGFYHVDYDPNHLDPAGTGNIPVGPGGVTASASGFLVDRFGQVDSLSIQILLNSTVVASSPIHVANDGYTKEGFVVWQRPAGAAGNVSVNLSYHMNSGPSAVADFHVTVLTVRLSN